MLPAAVHSVPKIKLKNPISAMAGNPSASKNSKMAATAIMETTAMDKNNPFHTDSLYRINFRLSLRFLLRKNKGG
jgi:hypothetical protein